MKKIVLFFIIFIALFTNIQAVYHKIAHYETSEIASGGKIVGDNFFLLQPDKLTILDISNPENPVVISEVNFNENSISDIIIQDNLAFIGGFNLYILDISDFSNPQILSQLNIHGSTRFLILHNNLLISSNCDEGLDFIDVTDPVNPNIITNYDNYPCAQYIQLQWPILYVKLFDSNMVKVLDIEDLENIHELSTIYSYYDRFVIKDDVLYISPTDSTFDIYNVSNPFEPVLLNSINQRHNPIFVENNKLYSEEKGISVFQIDENYDISFMGAYDLPFIMNNFDVSNDTAFYVSKWNGLQILDLSDSTDDKTICNYDLPAVVNDMELYQNTVYIAYDNINYLAGIIDVTDFQSPQYHLFPYQLYTSNIFSFALKDDILYSRDFINICIYDLSNPIQPELIQQFDSGLYSELYKLLVKDNSLIEYGNNINVYSVENPSDISYSQTYTCEGIVESFAEKDSYYYSYLYQAGIKVFDTNSQAAYTLPVEASIKGMNIYNNMLFASSTSGILIYDISNPMLPQLITTIRPHNDSHFSASPIVENNQLIVADNNWDEISVYDISDINNISLLSRYSCNLNIQKMILKDNYLYTGSYKGGFSILNIQDMLDSKEDVITHTISNIDNYPNPFNPNTTIKFTLQNNGVVDLSVYNMKGQKITTLKKGFYKKGRYKVNWNGKDKNGKTMSSGVYILKLKLANQIKTKKIMMLK